MEKKEVEDYVLAGKIAKEVRAYSKKIIKPGMKLVEIAEKIESKIYELGAGLAFPVNLSIDDVAAHYTPTLKDDKVAKGLLKVDFGVHVNGFICDSAFSLDLTLDKIHTSLIAASEAALNSALEEVKQNGFKTKFKNIGKKIYEEIVPKGFSPIRNLSGHSLGQFQVHDGATIPNYENGNSNELGEGAFAIEPFATTGTGLVYEGSGSNIYRLVKTAAIRHDLARKILKYLSEEKKTLPFSQREIEKKFGDKTVFALNLLKNSGIVEEYAQLIEKGHGIVSQAEKSLVISKDKTIILGE